MIIEYQPNLAEKIKTLLKDISYYMMWGEETKATFTAIVEGEIVAVGSLWKNDVHPHRNYLGIYVKPSYRRKGIATKFLKQLYDVASTPKFQVALQSDALPGIQLLEKNGFLLVRKSFTPELIECREKFNYSENINVKSYDKLSETQETALFDLQLKNYKEFHQAINPLKKNMSLGVWKRLIMSNLDEKSSFVLLKGNQIEAYLLCYKTDIPNEIEIVYVGGREVNQLSNYLSFYQSILVTLKDSYDKIFIEADDVDPFAFAVLNQFKYDEDISFDTYIL